MSKCRNSRNHFVLPIFYDVTPAQVRHQSVTYEEAFKLHSERYDEKTVQEWRNALAEIGSMKGWELQNVADGHEGELVKIVVSKVWRELKKARLIVEDSIIKVEDSIEEVTRMLRVGSGDVRVVGIYGIGGIGKTTLAKIIYNQLLEHFEYSCFLEGIHAKGLEKLQTQLANDILRSRDLQAEFANVDEGIDVLSKKFRDKKVLILLDDVDNKKQINALADLNWFAGGSRIIITTRDKGVLDVSNVKETCEVRPMHYDEALHLFNMHAFKGELRAADYVDLSEKIIATTGGLPLALEIIGSFLSTKKRREIWKDTLEKLRNCPHEGVQDKLRISYDALKFEQQQIFLDIACFFIGTDKSIATYMWKNSGFYPEVEVDVLLQRCLIKIGDDNKFWMHDQLRDLSREIVRNENISEPGERSRLWSSEDVRHVLENQELGNKLKVLILESCSVLLKTPDLSKFQKLERLSFEGCGSLYQVDPSIGELKNLIFLNLRKCSPYIVLPKELSDLQALVELYIDDCGGALPSLGGLKELELLSAKRCSELNYIPPSIGHLTSLSEISLDECKVCALPDSVETLVKLKCLSLRCCPLEKLPDSIGQLTSLEKLFLSRSTIEALTDSIGNLTNLQVLLVDETKIMNLPSTLGMLEKLEVIDASGCKNLRGEISIDLWRLRSLRTLKLNWTNITMLPTNINRIPHLQTLQLAHCNALQTLPQLPTSLQYLSVTCKPIKTFSDHSINMNLLELILMECITLKRIPGLGDLVFLKILMLSDCQNLVELEDLKNLECLRELSISRCGSLEKLSDLPKSKQLKTLKVYLCKSLLSIPNLSALKMLRHLSFAECEKLRMVEGLGELESLEHLNMEGCKSIENLPNLSKLGKLKELILAGCKKLRKLQGLEELKSLERVDIRYSPSLYYYTEEWPHIPWDYLPRFSPVDLSDYKVFLSFRGQDFSIDVSSSRDDGELGRGRLEAINRQKISIPILSKGYAFSIRCLQELAHIVECKKKSNQLVLPIFYDVSPDQVQEQSGSYEEAFKQHTNCYGAKIVEVWRAALREVGALNGWELQHVVDEQKKRFAESVLHNVLTNLAREYKDGIIVHVEEVMKMLEINASDVRMVGIHGMAGIGKTTLAKVIYNQLKKHFVYHNFFTNIRESSQQNRGLEELQSRPLLDIIRADNRTEFEFASLEEGINLLRHVDKKVLIVVDDVDQGDQLDTLVPYDGLFAPGSRIIITTRKKEALDIYQVQGTYELNELQFNDALVLFYKHAFKSRTPSPRFITLSHEIVLLLGGFPLAVEVIGSFLHEKDETWWEYMLKELKGIPHNDVRSKLRIIYDNLNDEVQEAFLDTACFFIGTDTRIARYMFKDYIEWNQCTEMLLSFSLVKLFKNGELWMHDHFRDLGREIAQSQRYNISDKRIRLWHNEEAVEVLNKKQNTERIKAICLDYGAGLDGCCFESNQFTLLLNLEFLQLNKANIAGDFNSLLSNLKILRWHHCPNELFATNLSLKRLLVLELSESDITDDWNGWSFIRMSINLEVLILKSCRRITKAPDFSTFRKLSMLILDDCTSLNYVDPSLGRLERLLYLSVKGCSRLEVLPPELTFPKHLKELHIDGTYLKGVPAFKDPVKLHRLSLKSCKSLRELPSSIGRFSSLKELDLSHTSIHALPDYIGGLKELKLLNMSASSIEYLPRTLGKLEQLEVIDVSYCRNLHGEIILEPMRLFSLREFIMDGTNITLPPSISGILRLRRLNWDGCYVPRAFVDSDDVNL